MQYGSVANVQEIDFEGQSGGVLCFAPEGYLVPGDVMLAQKIALETDELETLAVANRVAPVGRRRGSGGVGGPDSLSPAAAGMNDQNTHGVLRFVPDRDFRNSSVVGALKDDQDQVADRRTGLPVEQARVAGPAGTNRDLKRRVTMLRDQTTRSKLAARQPNGRNPDRLTLHFLPLENLKPVLIAATAVLDLIALRPAWGMVK